MVNNIIEIKEKLKIKKPLIHCITNPISINQCANVVLSVGARPIMAEHPKEVLEITSTSDALMLNLGNITDARMESMIISLKTAKKKGIPVLLDAVGVACSRFRKDYSLNLINMSPPNVIKGNYSEIRALYDKDYSSSGVDAQYDDIGFITEIANKLSIKYKTVILATGQTDVVADGEKTVYIKNGTPNLTSVTGTGCMLGALTSAFLTASNPVDAVVSSCGYFGICGQRAITKKGSGSFMVSLMDKIATLSKKEILKYLNTEEIL